ncbi:hypothetical protein BOB52_02020 [Bordetella pertussis]|nr:hypothetical protein BOB52_02020 [Bordetella pertussis]
MHGQASGQRDRAGQVPGPVFGDLAYVQHVEIGAPRVALVEPARQHRGLDAGDPGRARQGLRAASAVAPACGACRQAAGTRTALQGQAGQAPAHGAILQRIGVLHAQQAQALAGDDAAGASRAVHHYRLARAAQVVGVPGQVAAECAGRARNACAAVFLGRADIADPMRAAGFAPGLQGRDRQGRRGRMRMDRFAEPFAWHIAAAAWRFALGQPCPQAAIEHAHTGVAKAGQRLRGQPRARVGPALVVQHDGRGPARHQAGDARRQHAARQEGCAEDVALVRLRAFAHIEQGVFVGGCAQVPQLGNSGQFHAGSICDRTGDHNAIAMPRA